MCTYNLGSLERRKCQQLRTVSNHLFASDNTSNKENSNKENKNYKNDNNEKGGPSIPKVEEESLSFPLPSPSDITASSILKELASIQQQGPQKYCILGTRHCSYLHQQIIELLAYALVLSGNHVYTSGAGGTHAATIRGAERASQGYDNRASEHCFTVVLPQSLRMQPLESQELLSSIQSANIVEMPQNDGIPLEIASRICNSYLLSHADQLISFAFRDSTTVIEASKEAKKLEMLVTTLYLD